MGRAIVLVQWVSCDVPTCQFNDTRISLIEDQNQSFRPIGFWHDPKQFAAIGSWQPLLREHNLHGLTSNVPEEIQRTVAEAAACLDISPHATIVLARRALQDLLRKYYKSGPAKDTLDEEIKEVERCGDISPLVSDAMHAIRKIGNFGAHPERLGLDEIKVTVSDGEAVLGALRVVFEMTYAKDQAETERIERVKAALAEIPNR
jgi:hypothetical protein